MTTTTTVKHRAYQSASTTASKSKIVSTMIGRREPIMEREPNCKSSAKSLPGSRATSHQDSSQRSSSSSSNMSHQKRQQQQQQQTTERLATSVCTVSHLNDLKTAENLSLPTPTTMHENLNSTSRHITTRPRAALVWWSLMVAACWCYSMTTPTGAHPTRQARRDIGHSPEPRALDYQSTSLMLTSESRLRPDRLQYRAPSDYQSATDGFGGPSDSAAAAADQAATSAADQDSALDADADRSAQPSTASHLTSDINGGGGGGDDDDESVAENHQPDEQGVLMDHHTSQLKAMHDLFERRQMSHQRHPLQHNQNHQHQHHHHHDTRHQSPLQSSQELSPISIGLDPGSPFSMPPFPVAPNGHEPVPPPPPPPPALAPHPKAQMSNADNIDQGLGPGLPFGLNPLPHLMGFPGSAFEGPQRGDQSAHSNYHTPAPIADSEGSGGVGVGVGGGGPSQKVWPKIFRFTDGRINLSDFEKQKKIRLSNKNQHQGDNYIESAPIMFDGRPLKRKSFLILHGGIFSR